MCCRIPAVLLYLTEHINQSAADPSTACHDAVTRELTMAQHTHDIEYPISQKETRLSCSLCAPCYLVLILFHTKVGAAMFHKHVRLHKGLRVQQKFHALPGCQLTLQPKKVSKETTYGVTATDTITIDTIKSFIHHRFCPIVYYL